MPQNRKFTTSKTSLVQQKPVAVLALQRVDALIGSIIQLDGRKSYDPQKKQLSWAWRFRQVPFGSLVEASGFRPIRPRDTAVSFIPDKVGIYVIELVVNNGDLSSDPVTATVSIQISRVPCGENIVPDAHFLWEYISNFWSLVDDREVITSIWSSTIQLIGAELTTLWDADNNKSLDTIQNSFQRRWQPFNPSTLLIGELDHRVITGKTDSGSRAFTGNIDEEPGEGSTSVIYTHLGEVRGVTETDFTNLRGNYGAKGRIIVVNGVAYTLSRADNKSLSITGGSDLAQALGEEIAEDPAVDVEAAGGRPGDLLIIETGPNAGTWVLTRVDGAELYAADLSGEIAVFAASTGDTFSVERPFTLAITDEEVVPDGQAEVSWRIPHLLHLPNFDLEAAGVRSGDVVVFEVTREDIGLSTELRAQVVGADRNRLGFEFTLGELEDGAENIDLELFKQLALDLKILPPASTDAEADAIAKALISFIPVGININTRPFTKFRITFKAKKVIHNTLITVDENLIGAPALQESLKDPPVVLRENLDYIVDQGNIRFIGGLFTPEDPAPETLWAECAIYDNANVIENNFGRLVSLSKDDLSAVQTRARYLSAVRGLFFAFTNGPAIANIRLGLQILLGLPFTEERGIILEIQEDFTVDSRGLSLGRVLMEDVDETTGARTGFRRVHLYPMVVGLEDHPFTGEPFKVGDVLERFTPISKGVEVKDYIKNPHWWENALVGLEILKYFVFNITIDSGIFDTNDVRFAFEFVKTIKPAYTRVIATALLELSDDVEIDDDIGGAVVLKFYDSPWGLEDAKRADDMNHQGVRLTRAGSKPLSTRTTRMLKDLITSRDAPVPGATKILVHSDIGWDASLLRGRDESALPTVEGDLLFIHGRQPGAGFSDPGVYEIDNVIDDNNLELLASAPPSDPSTFVPVPLDANTFDIGFGLTGSIMRRELNPVLRGDDLETTIATAVASSVTAEWNDNGVCIGDHLIIEEGDDAGEYLIDASIPAVDYPRDFPRLDDQDIEVRKLDGTAYAFTNTASNLSFRVVRPQFQPKVVTQAKSVWNGTEGRQEVEVLDPPNSGSESFDVFSPGMVGNYLEVAGSDNPVNDGRFLILEYINSGRVVVDSPSSTSDGDAASTIYL